MLISCNKTAMFRVLSNFGSKEKLRNGSTLNKVFLCKKIKASSCLNFSSENHSRTINVHKKVSLNINTSISPFHWSWFEVRVKLYLGANHFKIAKSNRFPQSFIYARLFTYKTKL